MKNKFLIYPYILLFIVFNHFPFLNLQASQKNIDKKITVEYLDQLPSNKVIQDFTHPFVGIFSTYGLIKAIND